MQLPHATSHELVLLERFVGDCVQRLPALPPSTAPQHQLPPRAADYHTRCAAMLRDVVHVVASLSPRLAQLVAQIWELTSLNVFALLQLAQTALDERDVALAKWRQLQRFSDETAAQHARRVVAYEREREAAVVETRELRAELQATRQRANRLGVENAQLRRAVQGLMEMNDALDHGVHSEQLDDAASLGSATTASEDWALYGVGTDELERLEIVDPIESCAHDFDHVCEGLRDQAREQMALLNALDRFMNSSVVALLWRHGPDESETKFLEQMMSRRSSATQTDDDELDILADALGVGRGREDDEEDDEHADRVSGETGTATRVTKRQVLPRSLRAQLTTRPKIQRVLEKHELARAILRLLVDKMESDGVAVRASQPRAALHRIMKDSFVQRYGLVALAEYRLLQVVKSVLYYHEKHEAEARRLRLLTGTTSATLEEENKELKEEEDAAHVFSLLPGLQTLALGSDDLRVLLFARLCELVPLQWPSGRTPPPSGNLWACAANALLDFLGDVIELDRASESLRDVVEHTHASDWTLPHDVARTLVEHHFAHCELSRRQRLLTRLAKVLASSGASGSVTVDALLVFVLTQWLDVDQRLAAALHEAFRREASHLRLQPDDAMATLSRIWSSLPHDHVSLPELDALQTAFASVLELRQSQQHTPPSTASPLAAVGLCVGGVSENEFVFLSQQLLRARRVCRGLRTHGRVVSVSSSSSPTRMLGPRGRVLTDGAVGFAVDELKPAC
jgi:hypothetical protein